MKLTKEERLEIKRKIDNNLDKLKIPLLKEISKDRMKYISSLTSKDKLDIIIDNMFPTENMINKHSTSNTDIIAYREIRELNENRHPSLIQIRLIKSKFKDYYSHNLPEGFKAIPGHPNNAINKDGVVIVIRTRLIRRPSVDKEGYIYVMLDGKTKSIHRLAMLTFVGYSKLQVDHINNISYDNRLVNLEYVTAKENIRRAIATGVKPVGEEVNGSKLTKEEAIDIINDKVTPIAELARKYNVSKTNIRDIKKRLIWKHLSDGIDI